MLQDIDQIDFVRIDGDQNDLPWQYTIDKFPALLIFPENRWDNVELYQKLNNLILRQFLLEKQKVEFTQRNYKLTFKIYSDFW